MIIRGDPAHPDATGLLTSKHSHRIVVLVKEGGSNKFIIKNIVNILSIYLSVQIHRSYCGRVKNDVDIISVIWHHILH